MSEFSHISVLLNEVIEGLEIKPDGIYADGTVGGGGHSYEIAARLSDNGRLIGIDRDEDAVKAASERLACYGDKAKVVRGNYLDAVSILKGMGSLELTDFFLTLAYRLTNSMMPREAFPTEMMLRSTCVWTDVTN